jgi:hypothetical protein
MNFTLAYDLFIRNTQKSVGRLRTNQARFSVRQMGRRRVSHLLSAIFPIYVDRRF